MSGPTHALPEAHAPNRASLKLETPATGQPSTPDCGPPVPENIDVAQNAAAGGLGGVFVGTLAGGPIGTAIGGGIGVVAGGTYAVVHNHKLNEARAQQAACKANAPGM